LFLFHWVRRHLETARTNADEMLRIAEQADDPALLLIAHFSLGGALWHIGNCRPALTHLLEAHARYDEKAHAPLALAYGQDFGVCTLSYLQQAQLWLGYPDEGARAIEEGLSLARRLNYPLTVGNALNFNALSSVQRRDPASARKFTEELRRLAGENGFPQYLALAAFNGGWALAQLGSPKEGVEEIQQGIAAWHALGAAVALPGILAMLAESQLAAGRHPPRSTPPTRHCPGAAKTASIVMTAMSTAVGATYSAHWGSPIWRATNIGRQLKWHANRRPSSGNYARLGAIMIRRLGFELRHQAPCTPWKQVTDLANAPELETYFAEPGLMEE
jgi:tetratricopeptide (TPR) repeat protein